MLNLAKYDITLHQAATVQTVATLNYNDRVFFIVQNKDAASEITVEFLKLIAWQ